MIRPGGPVQRARSAPPITQRKPTPTQGGVGTEQVWFPHCATGRSGMSELIPMYVAHGVPALAAQDTIPRGIYTNDTPPHN